MSQALFKKKTIDTKSRPDYPICGLLRVNRTNGEIGIEIELEGNKFQKQNLPPLWSFHQDGSLRGKDNAEYVLKNPIKFTEVGAALDSLWDMCNKYGTIMDDSNRTSVHIHLNVQNFHLNRLAAFTGLYFCVEELLTQWCGDYRVGNLFCLRAKDAPAAVGRLKKFITTNGNAASLTEGLHYAAFNTHAITKFGSIEIRTLRGVNDPQIIKDWVSILQRLYELSADFPDPRMVCADFSGNGPMSFLRQILGDKTDLVLSGIDYNQERIREAMYEGIRLAQDICYCRDWEEYKPVEVTTDPFGRIKKPLGTIDFETLAQPYIIQTGPTHPFAAVPPPVIEAEMPLHEEEPDMDDDDHEFIQEIMPDWDDEE